MPELNQSSFSTRAPEPPKLSKAGTIGAGSLLFLALELARVAVRHFWGIELPF